MLFIFNVHISENTYVDHISNFNNNISVFKCLLKLWGYVYVNSKVNYYSN